MIKKIKDFFRFTSDERNKKKKKKEEMYRFQETLRSIIKEYD